MSEIVVAIICNLVAALLLTSGVLTSLKCGWKVALTKFCLMLGGVAAAYFLTPFISDKILGIERSGIVLADVLLNYGITQPIINSCLFAIIVLLIYILNISLCSLLKYRLIKGMKKDITLNSAKIKRAKSINPKAEKVAKKTIYKEMKNLYESNNTFFKKLISLVLGIVVSVALGIVLLMPFGYISKSFVDGDKAYLYKGYEKTLNGVIGQDAFDFIISADNTQGEVDGDVEDEDVGGDNSIAE